MDDQAPLVTINIVTRNRKDALKRAVQSAYAQTHRPIEVVIVDNDSDDGSPEMIETEWPEIRVIRIHTNIGCQPGRNIGMKNSRGKYIFNLDDDGHLHPQAIEKVVRRFEAEPDVALITAAVHLTGEERSERMAALAHEIERYVSGFFGGASCIRSSVLPETGYFPEYPRGHSEADLALRILDRRYEMLYLPDVVMYHDVSDIERDENVHMYYEVWHRLETAFRLEPLSYCLIACIWRMGVDFRIALRRRCMGGYLKGTVRFLYEFPRVVANRRPVSRWATGKRDFLAYSYVADGALARGFEGRSIWRTIKDRLRKRHLKTAPD